MRAVYSIVKSCGDHNARDRQDNRQHITAARLLRFRKGNVSVPARLQPFPPLPGDATRAKIHDHIESVKTTMAVCALSGAFWLRTVASCTAPYTEVCWASRRRRSTLG